MNQENRDNALEMLDDLQHDLGKYIHLPVSFLPSDASEDMFREAVFRAIYQTRRSRAGVESALDIWQHFCQESGGLIMNAVNWPILVKAVESALTWGPKARQPNVVLDRALVVTDLKNVGRAITQLQDELDE